MSDIDLAFSMGLSHQRSALGDEGVYGDRPGQKPLLRPLPEVDLDRVGKTVERAFLASQEGASHPLDVRYELTHVDDSDLTTEEVKMVQGLLKVEPPRKHVPSAAFGDGAHRTRAIWLADPSIIIPFECSALLEVLSVVYGIISGANDRLWNRDLLKSTVKELRVIPEEMSWREMEASNPLVGEIDLLNTLTPDQVLERYAAYAE